MNQQPDKNKTWQNSAVISRVREALSLKAGSAKKVNSQSTKRLTFYLCLTGLSLIALGLTIISFYQNWPLKVFYLFGANSMTGAEKAGKVLRLPALMFFGFLSAYLTSRCVQTYRSSFDRQFARALQHRDKSTRRKRPRNRVKK